MSLVFVEMPEILTNEASSNPSAMGSKLPTGVDMMKDPRVKILMGYDRMEAVLIVLLVLVDLATSMAFSLNPDLPWYAQFFMVFCIGTTIRHACTLGMHECSHNLVGATENENYWWGFVANIPLVFPASVRFRRYHMIHHANPNSLAKDPDMLRRRSLCRLPVCSGP